jgi:hypothetical protein
VNWLRRFGGAPPADSSADEADEAPAEPVTRAAPGLAALFDGVASDGQHTLLDLGTASAANLDAYGRYADRVRFAGLVGGPVPDEGWAKRLAGVPSFPGRPYDLIVAWNLFDFVPKGDRRLVVDHLVRIAAPRARLYLVVDMSGEGTVEPARYTLLEGGRLASEPVGSPVPAAPALLPAAVERLLDPFRVEHAFTLRSGQREYMAVRRSRSS